MRWPAKPRIPINIRECGPGVWDERDHGLDYPGSIHTTDFRVTGRGHARIEQLFQTGCAEGRRRHSQYDDNHPEQRIAKWLCRHACSFVLFATNARVTVIGFERPEDAEAFKREFAPG